MKLCVGCCLSVFVPQFCSRKPYLVGACIVSNRLLVDVSFVFRFARNY